MAKTKTVFYCTSCGNETPKWMGRCPSCGAYNTMEEHVEKPVAAGKAKSAPVGMSRKPQRIREITSDGEIRFSTGMGELDRVLGGGAVAGSLVLVGGAPGIGKSTLLLQICSSLCVGPSGAVRVRRGERAAARSSGPSGLAVRSGRTCSFCRKPDSARHCGGRGGDANPTFSSPTPSRPSVTSESDVSAPGSICQVKDCTMAHDAAGKRAGYNRLRRWPYQ